MKVCTFYTGSHGNCTFIMSRQANILLDCGRTKMEIEHMLNKVGAGASMLDGILITHEHIDHVRGLTILSNTYNIPIYAHEEGAQPLILSVKADPNKIKTFNKPFSIKDVNISYIKCKHDSVYCVGYRIESENESFVCITDTGCMPDNYQNFVKNANLVLLESNHDINMLNNGPYPMYLKRRILSNKGHLSNFQAAQAVSEFPSLNVGHVWLGHMSETNNTSELAFTTVTETLKSKGIQEGKDINIDVIPQGKRSDFVNVRHIK